MWSWRACKATRSPKECANCNRGLASFICLVTHKPKQRRSRRWSPSSKSPLPSLTSWPKSIRSSRDQYRGPEFRAPFHRLSAVIRPLSLAPRSVQGDLQRSQQIVRFKRFEHHRVLMFQAGCRVSVSGKYHDRKRRRIGSGLDAVYQFQTAHQWQFEIDENKVRKLNIHDADGRPAIGCRNDFVIGSLYY